MTAGPLPANPGANSILIWDGENRMVSATVNGVTTTYRYDAQSRLIAVWGAGLQPATSPPTTAYVYDAWNPIAEYGASYALTKTNTWGLDLSGTMQGAGGVGGLLSITDGTGTYFPTYDGNGNVSEYLDASGNVVAHYEYDPFGKTTVASGAKAQDFSHRFSTKPLDAATGLYYYGYRYYDPVTGRWPSRDPIGERGGVNLYGFIGNDGVNWVDVLGLQEALSDTSYNDMDTAAWVGLLLAGKMQLADKPDHFEYSGAICCRKGKFKYTGPFKGNSRTQSNKEKTLKCPEGWKLRAYYHSHPGYGQFNYGDTIVTLSYDIYAYVVGTGIGLEGDHKIKNLFDDMYKYKAGDPNIGDVRIPNVSDKLLKQMEAIAQVHKGYKFDKKSFTWVRVSEILEFDYSPYIESTKEVVEFLEDYNNGCDECKE